MARPLNKKYFGNRNIGTSGYQNGLGDDKIGGEGVAGVTFGASVADTSYGSGAYLDRMPSISSLSAPTIPGGVQAVAAVTNAQAVHGVVNQSGTPNGADYLTGDILTVTTGTATISAKFTVGALQVSGFTIVTGNDGNLAHGYAVGDTLNFDNGVVLTVATIDETGYAPGYGVVTSCTLTNAGSYTGTTPPTGTVGHTNSLGGQGFTVNFSWGVKDVTVLVQGDYTAVQGGASATTVTHGDLTASSATGCTLDIYYGIKTITVSQKGSGYTGAETITFANAIVEASETQAAGAIVLTTDSGAVGSATNQENAVVIHANTTNSGTKIGDIIKQTNDRRYKVKTADGIAKCILVSTTSPTSGQAYIKATDTDGGTYLVEKLTAHMAVIRPVAVSPASAGTQFPLVNGLPQKVEWTMNGTSGTKVAPGQPYLVAGVSVKIENA